MIILALPRDATLETRSARARLRVQKKPFYRLIEPGQHLGYRRLANKPGTWLVRRYSGAGAYTLKNLTTADGALVIADDYSEANGEGVLTFGQAQAKAKAFRPEAAQPKGPYTVARAMADYFVYLREEGRPEHLVREAEQRSNALILPKLGPMQGRLSVCALVCRRELGDMECDRQGHIWRTPQRR